MSEESKPFTVMVPCSTSNIGAGFDAIGIALSGPDMMVRVKPGGERLRITRLSGEGEERLPPDATNRVIQAAHQAAAGAAWRRSWRSTARFRSSAGSARPPRRRWRAR
jgi:homoserine kinase